jgi:hypothetical protein
MIKKAFALLAVVGAACSLFANVDLRTNINDIYYRGTCEEAGSITMSVNGDDFSEASTAQPVFIRVRLDQGATLCQTLVNNRRATGNPNTETHNIPIYLAMRIESSLSTGAVGITAPADTVSIVRWKRGETDIWLRVTTPSSSWVQLAGQASTQAPDNQVRVAWTFGTTARTSQLTDDKAGDSDYEQGLSNLPFNTRNFAAFTDRSALAANVDTRTERADYAQSTLLCINVSNATFLEPLPAANSLVNFDTISFIWNEANDPEGPLNPNGPSNNSTEHDGNVRTATNPASILRGNIAQATFSGDDSIARGFDLPCAITTSKDGEVSRSLCFDNTVINQAGDTEFDLVCSPANSLRVTILGCYGWNTNSVIALQTAAGADYGFRVAKAANGALIEDPADDSLVLLQSRFVLQEYLGAAGVGPAMGISAYAPKSSLFDGAGESNALASIAILTYTDEPSISTADPTLLLTTQVCMDPTDPPQDIVLEGTVSVTNKDKANDNTPYDGLGETPFNVDIVNGVGTTSVSIFASDQYQFCPPVATEIGSFTWNFGSFDECVSTTRIFYPFLPAVAGNPTFWSGISFVNQGFSELDSVFGILYEADGSGWWVQFPSLPVRNQQTWLLQDNNGVAFVDTEGVQEPRTLSPLGNDIVPLNQRSSMFVVGYAEGQTNADVAVPDLDGFCLIGNTQTQVIYGYLARNIGTNAGTFWQHMDLPPWAYAFKNQRERGVSKEDAKFDGLPAGLLQRVHNRDNSAKRSPFTR